MRGVMISRSLLVWVESKGNSKIRIVKNSRETKWIMGMINFKNNRYLTIIMMIY